GSQRRQSAIAATGSDHETAFAAGGGGGEHEYVTVVAVHQGGADPERAGLRVDGVADARERSLALGDRHIDRIAVTDADRQRAVAQLRIGGQSGGLQLVGAGQGFDGDAVAAQCGGGAGGGGE